MALHRKCCNIFLLKITKKTKRVSCELAFFFLFRLVFYYKTKKITTAQNKFLEKRKAHRQGNITTLDLYMVQQLNHPSKKVVPAPPFSCPHVLKRKNRIDTRQEHQTPPPNHRREIQAGAFHSPETIHASKLELPRTRVALRRTHHQSPPTGKSFN